MKKGQIIEGVIERVDFPNKGIIRTEDGRQVIVKNTIQGQKVSASINKIRKGKAEGRLLEVLEKSPLEGDKAGCVHAGECGGCTYQTLPYDRQLEMKAEQVKKLMDDVIDQENRDYQFLGIKESPRQTGYRNKMEFSFGDEFKDGPLALGMHKRGSFYDIVTVENCQISHSRSYPSMPTSAFGSRYSGSNTMRAVSSGTRPLCRGMPNLSVKSVRICAIG